MIGGADENEPEDQLSTRTTTSPPSSPSPTPPPPPIASPSSPLQQTAGVGLGRRLLGSIRSLLPASPPAAAPAPKLGLGLLLHLRPDHPRLHPTPTPTPPASASPSASEEDPLEEDAAAARPHAAAGRGDGGLDAAAGLHSSADTGGDVALEGDQEAGLVDGQQGAAPAAKEFRAGDESRPTDVASPSASEEDESRATGVSSASEDHEPEEGGSLDAAEWLRERDAGAGLRLPPVNIRCGLGEDGAATRTAPPNIMFKQWAAKQAPQLLQYLRPAAETGGELVLEEEQEGGLALVDGHGHGQEGTIHTQAAAPAKGDDQFCANDESGASEEEDLMGEKEKVVEQQGAADRQGTLVKDVDSAGDDQEKVLQQCTGDQLRAARDDQEVGEQDAIHPRDETPCDIAAAEDQEKVRSAKNVDVVEGQEVVGQDGIHPRDATTYYIAVEEQEKVEGHGTNQCGSTGNNDDAVEDQEVLLPDVIDRKGEGTDGTAVHDQDKAVQQCDTYELGTTENDDAVAKDDQEAVEQGVCDEGDMDDDNAAKDHEAAGQSVIDRMHTTIVAIAVEDQEKGVAATYAVAEDDQEAVEQGVCDEGGMDDDNAAKDHEAAGQSVIDRMHTTIVAIAVEDQEKGVAATYDLGTVENDDVMDDQEVVEQDTTHPMDDIAVEEEEKLERHATHWLGSTENVDDAVEDQEVLLRDVIDRKGEGTDGTAVDDQDKAVQQCDTYELGTIENDDDDAEDDQEAVQQGVCDEGGMDDDNAVKDHEAAGQSVIDRVHTTIVAIAVEDQEKGVAATYDLGTVENDDVMDDQEVVEQDATHPMDDIAVEEEEKLERQATHGLGSTGNNDDAVEDQEVLLPDVIDRKGEGTDGTAVDDQDKAVQQCDTYELGTTENDDDAAEDDQEAVQQGVCDEGGMDDDNAVQDHEAVIDRMHATIDAIAVEDQEKGVDATYDLGTVENDDVMDDQEVVGQDTTHPMDSIAVEEEEKLERHSTHGLGSTENVDDAVEDQEVVEQCVIDRKDESTDGTAVDDQEKAVEQCSAYGLGTTENDDAKDDQEAVEVVSATANGSDGDIWKKEKVKLPYPQRPGKLNCPFYMSKGSCSYGFSCNFHHPRLKAKPDGSWCSSEQRNQGVADILELNRIGLPIREGARNCTYYMRNGACRYGKHCHFNHPEHVIDAQFYAPTGWEDSALQLEKSFDLHTTVDDTSHLKKSSDDATLDGTSYSKKSSDHATLDDTSSSTGVLPPNILRMLLPPQKVPATTEAKVIPVKKDSNWLSTSDESDGCCSADSSDGPLCKQEHVDCSDGSLCKQEHVDYPERPGRQECPFYTRFGDCKFASRCKYYHPVDKYPTRYRPEVPSLGGEQTEYPERPGEPECPFYMKAQFCKFGAQCKFDHPKDSNPTSQSPVNAEKSVAANEHHQPTIITLEDHMPQQQQYPERPGQPDCRYYLQFGKCKFLSACIFHHPRDVLPSGPAHTDQIGPEIHGMPECPFYMKSGKCQFGPACEFLHPKDICSTTEGAFGHRTGSAYDNFTRPKNVVQQREQTMYPERPGEPECFHYMRHGSCRFQMNCRYHHPADRLSRKQYDSTYH